MSSVTSSAAVVLAAGQSRRFGRLKQFETIDGRTLVGRVVATASSVCDLVILVLPTDHELEAGHHSSVADDATSDTTTTDDTPTWEGMPVHAVVHGGRSHGESARIGLEQVPDHIDVVVMASASHPLAGPDLYRRTIKAVANGADAAAPVGAICDAVKEHDGGTVVRSVDKSQLVTAQAPCAFSRTSILAAYEAFGGPDQPPLPPEELEMIEHLGGRIELVDGEPTNIHVTTPTELEMARRLADLVV